MSVGTKLLQAAAGGGSDPVYVDDVFSCFLYEGNATSRSIVNGIDLADKGGLVWTKNRDDQYDHNFVDSARGLTNSPYLRSNTTGSQGTDGNGITVFNNNGYTVGTSGSWNTNGNSHVSWTFAKQEKFFDIVTYTGNGTAGRTVSHNLGSVPGMIIVKRTDTTQDWVVYHRSLSANTKSLFLNENYAETSYSWLNSTDPTSTVVTLGDRADVNASSGTYVMYLFAHDEQEFGENSDEAIIKCDGYTGNGSTTGPVINLGFEPQWILIKRLSANGDWMLFDVMRGIPSGSNVAALFPNAADSETSTDTWLEVNPTGFQIKHDHGRVNVNSATYAYMAIRRPNKPASEFAATDLYTAAYMTSGPPLWNSNFPVDSGWYKQRAGTGSSVYLFNRLTDGGYMQTHSTSAEASAGAGQFDFQDGWYNSNQSATTYISWMFRRAKGFFDVVAYTGTGSATTINHNLGVVPELMWLRGRSEADSWVIWDKNADLSTSTPLFSDFTQARRYNRLSINSTAPTASVFSIGAAGYSTNSNGATYIAYLFASVDGISKVGTYTGTGSDVNVDCGFSAGARFVLIWRTDSSGPEWYLFDTLRGIVAGNDEYAVLNPAAADVTNTDYIDPLNAGFTVTSSAPAALNNSGGTYAFLAIA
jgi:hypothetical protein